MNLNGRGCNRGSISIITVLLALPKLLLLPSLAGAFFAPIGVVSSSARSSASVAGGSARENVGAARVPPSLGRQDGIFATSEEGFGGAEMSPDAKSTPPPEGGANPLQQRRLSPAAHDGDNGSEVAAPVGPAPPAEIAKEAEPALVRVRAKGPPSLWNVPNMLTMARVVAIPVFATVFYASLPRRNVWCSVIFAGAALTDWLDGYIARKQGIVTPFGAFLDPVADKLMVSTALILLSERLGPWMTICSVIILCRELAISALREWMAQLGLRETVKVGNAGKWKTATQMAALSLLLLLEPGAAVTLVNPATFMPVAKGLLYISTILTVTSGSGYLKAAWPALMGRAKQESPP